MYFHCHVNPSLSTLCQSCFFSTAPSLWLHDCSHCWMNDSRCYSHRALLSVLFLFNVGSPFETGCIQLFNVTIETSYAIILLSACIQPFVVFSARRTLWWVKYVMFFLAYCEHNRLMHRLAATVRAGVFSFYNFGKNASVCGVVE